MNCLMLWRQYLLDEGGALGPGLSEIVDMRAKGRKVAALKGETQGEAVQVEDRMRSVRLPNRGGRSLFKFFRDMESVTVSVAERLDGRDVVTGEKEGVGGVGVCDGVKLVERRASSDRRRIGCVVRGPHVKSYGV